jgi:hypothetical protein
MAQADAERRGSPELAAAREGLAKSTEARRAADWNDAPARRGEAEAPGRSKDLPPR